MNKENPITSEKFATTIGLVLSLLGLAIGTGNIWRFPRVAALNGGGAFMIAYLISLFTWAIPIIITEFSCGMKFKKGVFAVFKEMLGPRWAWMGAFVALCTLGIMFYYSVVAGWCLKYFTLSVTGELLRADPNVLWTQFTQNSWQVLLFHFISITSAAAIIYFGVIRGIEMVNVVLIPIFFMILIFLVFFALQLPGAVKGFDFLFYADFRYLLSARTWIEALSQSAWSTGAGWGIILTFAAYSHRRERPILHSFTTGFGDSSAALLASMCILATLFAIFPQKEALEITSSGNTGLTFISLPSIFKELEQGRIFAILFFLALSCAAFTSLISMLELGSHMLRNFGISRPASVLLVYGAGLLLGVPSAVNINILNNQDWVWGLGLLFSGFFFACLIHRYGVERFVSEMFPYAPKAFNWSLSVLFKWIIPLEFICLLTWWAFQSINENPGSWWNPFHSFSLGTCLLQWAIVFSLLIIFSRRLSERIK